MYSFRVSCESIRKDAMKIFLVEDEEKLVQHLKNGLEQEGYIVNYSFDGEEGQKYVELNNELIDLIILDLSLPTRDGMMICRSLRKKQISTPIIMLTARDTTDDRIIGLNAGADDYLIKPFAFGELLARIRALLRRPRLSLPMEIKVGNIILNELTRKVFCNGHELTFTLKEFSLLEYFMKHPNHVFDREQVIDSLWDMNFDSFSNVIDVHIMNIRKKLKEVGNEKALETVRGVGYRFKG